MKFVVVCAIVFFAATVTCFPASTDNIDDGEIEIFRPTYSARGSPFGHGVIDLDANDDDDDSAFFRGFNFRDLFNDLRQEIEKAQREYQQTLKEMLEKGNTTSTVEVIDGHKVIKNETVYEDPNSFIKSVVIHVVPNGDGNTDHTSIDHVTSRTKPKSRPSETYTPEPDTEPIVRKKEREPLGESVENEVDDRSEVENFNIETLDDNEIPSLDKFKYETDDGQNSPLEIFVPTRPEITYDLSNDIAVNGAPGLPVNPDAEYVDIETLIPPKLA